MPLRSISVPHFLRISRGFDDTFRELQNILSALGYRRPLIVTGRTSGGVLGEKLAEALAAHVDSFTCCDNTMTEVSKLCEVLKEGRPDVVVGVGGGKVLDVCKYAAAAESLPFISVPTQISNDGICSPVSVLKNEEGKTDSVGARIPAAIVIDFDVIVESPDSTVRAGVGDLVSNIFAVADWRLAAADKGEKLDDYAAMVAYTAAASLYESAGGLARVEVQRSAGDGGRDDSAEAPYDLHDERFLSLLANGLVLSGIAMELSGTSRPCSGAEHKISHSLDAFFGSPASHGDQVALGSIVSAYLHGMDWRRLRDFFRRIGLPDGPAAIGLSPADMAEAIIKAPQTRLGRYTILEKKALNEEEARRLVDEVWGA